MTFIPLRMSSVARFAGFGYRNLARLPVAFSLENRQGRLLSYLTRPGGIWPMPVEAWLSAIGPGRESLLRDHRVWATAQALWERVTSSILNRAQRFAYELSVASECQYVDLTVKAREGRVKSSGTDPVGSVDAPGATAAAKRPAPRISPWGRHLAETLGLDVHRDVWSTLFTEWVAYPFTLRLRKVLERADERLQTLDPKAQPQWEKLDELWTEVFELEEGIATLPSKIDYLDRETDEIAPSARLIALWTKLRSIGARGANPPVDLTDRILFAASPRRRRPLV